MTRDQLISGLIDLGVHPNSYSLDGIRNGDCVCVAKENSDEWNVFYVGRNSPNQLGKFNTAEDAYDFVYATFRKWLGIKA